MAYVRLSFKRSDLETLLGCIRSKLEDYTDDPSEENSEDEVINWYEEQVNILVRLAERLNDAGVKAGWGEK